MEASAIEANNEDQSYWQSRLKELFPSLHTNADPVLSQLYESARVVKLGQGRFVFRSGDLCDSFLLLLDGSVRVQLISAGGREVTLYRIGSGGSCILTTSCLLSSEHYPAEAVAESDIVAVAIPNANFQGALDGSRHFRDFVFAGFSTRLTSVIQRIDQLALTSINARLAAALIDMEKSGKTNITHQQLAVELGTAREVVSRHLKALEKEGTVRLGRSRVTVLDRERLQKTVDSGAM